MSGIHTGALPGGTQQQKQEWQSLAICRLHKWEAISPISTSTVY